MVTLLAGCGGRAVRPAAEVSTVPVGQCADPATSGVVSESPSTMRADRDLDGDGVAETVIADKKRCGDGNCHWNIFTSGSEAGCRRYLGTVSGQSIEGLDTRGPHGYSDVRGWWRLDSDDRYLLQLYEYQRGGYRLVEVLLCRMAGDDRLQCAMEDGQ